MDTITIYENGRPAGTLRLRREGLYTLLEAALPPAPGLTRLWLCGGGERADLGVMEPRPEGRRFCRRYTRAALAALPSPMEYAVAAPSGDTAPAQAEQNAPAAGSAPLAGPPPTPPANSADSPLQLPPPLRGTPLPEGGMTGAMAAGGMEGEMPPSSRGVARSAGGSSSPPHPSSPTSTLESQNSSPPSLHALPHLPFPGRAFVGASSGSTRFPVNGKACSLRCASSQKQSGRFAFVTKENLPANGAAAEIACRLPLPPAAAARNPQNSNLKTQNLRVVTFDDAHYLALPCQLRHPRPGLRLVTLDGQDYLLFRT